jgi:hypothetical protein
MTIKVHDVTPVQQRLLDTMWSLDTAQDYNSWHSKLSESKRKEVDVLEQLLVLALIDSEVEKTPGKLGLAQSMLANIMK